MHRPNEVYYEISMYRKWKKCDKETERFMLDSLTWEYSFYKFINNFFTTSVCAKSECGHDFYKDSKFWLKILGVRFKISLHDNPEYKILPIYPQKNMNTHYDTIRIETFVSLCYNSREILKIIIALTTEL